MSLTLSSCHLVPSSAAFHRDTALWWCSSVVVRLPGILDALASILGKSDPFLLGLHRHRLISWACRAFLYKHQLFPTFVQNLSLFLHVVVSFFFSLPVSLRHAFFLQIFITKHVVPPFSFYLQPLKNLPKNLLVLIKPPRDLVHRHQAKEDSVYPGVCSGTSPCYIQLL